MRSLVYKMKADTRPALLCFIFAVVEHMCNYSETIAVAAHLLLMIAEKCIDSQGGNFEQLLLFCLVYLMVWLLINM
jgi:hypothetical protein